MEGKTLRSSTSVDVSYDISKQRTILTKLYRQIRNAFQTAIALAEYESTVAGPGDPKPTLGKKQFESVAMGARKFDEYLTSTTGKSESDAARTDAWRDDRFATGVAAPAPAPPIRSLTAQYIVPRGLQKPRSARRDEDTDSASGSEASDSDSDSDSEAEAEAERKARARRGKKAATASKSPRRSATDSVSAADPAAEQYKQFLEWQKSQKG